MEKHDIERRDNGGQPSDTRYKDAEWLEEQYHDNGLTQYKIADKCGVDQVTVNYWMKKRGIESRDPTEHFHSDRPADQQMEQAEIAAYQD